MKKETLEEFCYKVLNYLHPNCKKEMSSLQYDNAILSLKYIAKWQQERSYNEEDLKYAYEQGKLYSHICYSRTFENVLEIIKIKKK